MADEINKQQSFVQYALTMILQGFLLGIGICIAFAIYQGIERGLASNHEIDSVMASVEFEDRKPEVGKDYRLDDVRIQNEKGRLWIVGKVTNLHPNLALTGVYLQANFYKGKIFVDQHSLPLAMSPSEVRLFKIDFACGRSPVAEHDRFEVVMVRSY